MPPDCPAGHTGLSGRGLDSGCVPLLFVPFAFAVCDILAFGVPHLLPILLACCPISEMHFGAEWQREALVARIVA